MTSMKTFFLRISKVLSTRMRGMKTQVKVETATIRDIYVQVACRSVNASRKLVRIIHSMFQSGTRVSSQRFGRHTAWP
jgi:hypothetical protein